MSSIVSTLARHASNLSASVQPVDLDGGHPVPDVLARSLQDLVQIDARGLGAKAADIPVYLNALKDASGNGIDDRQFAQEKLLTLMARAPDGFGPTVKLQQAVIDLLYKDLPHPPSGYLSLPPALAPAPANAGVRYAYRSADGSNYNPLFPSLGQANMPYARSVPTGAFVPKSALPDTGLVFDTLLRRPTGEAGFEKHPGGMSSLFFAFADLIIHCLFNTDPRDWTKNTTSSYLDLSVLYGSSEAQVGQMRKGDGTGMIWEDSFADARLMLMPPAVGALLVVFNRNHNYICQKILALNENGNLASPPPADAAAKRAQDDELFARARLVNSGYFMQVILADYVGAILGLVRDGLGWRLNPLAASRGLDHEVSPRGEGNAISVEFNLMYRWHAAISQVDEEWTEKAFREFWPDKSFSDITMDDFKSVAVSKLRHAGDPRTWTLGDLKRNADGRFDDAALAQIIQNATAAPASAFGARRTPEVLRIIEILGMEQARSWGVCTMNEFRSFMGLKPYKDFREWNPDPVIANAAEALYHDIDNLELHVGLQAEETKISMPGAGLCPGYTISRAILGDAVCLTRGDRFMTTEFTPFNFTSWGYQDCQINPHDGSYGGMLSKLLFRHLPEYYPRDSAYAFFPFMVPGEMRKAMEGRGDGAVGKYSWGRPGAGGAVGIMGTSGGEGDGYEGRMRDVARGVDLKGGVVDAVLLGDQEVEKWGAEFASLAKSLVKSKSVDHVGSTARYVDVVKDVVNLVPVYWIANDVLGLPLKTDANPRGSMRDQGLYKKFADVANYVFVHYDAGADWELRENSSEFVADLVERVKRHLERLRDGVLSVAGVTDAADKLYAGQNENSDPFQQILLKAAGGAKADLDVLAANLVVEVVSTAALWSRALALVVDAYVGKAVEGSDAAILALVREAVGKVDTAGTSLPSGRLPGLMNEKLFDKTAVAVLRAIFSLPGLARAPGSSGKLSKFTQQDVDGKKQLYVNGAGEIVPWPASLVVQYKQ